MRSDRSPEAGSLESRRGTLGNILRVMHSSNHFSSRDSAGEFLWCVCDSDGELFSLLRLEGPSRYQEVSRRGMS